MTIERDIVGGGDYDPSTGDIAPYKVPDQQTAIVAISGLTPAANKLPYFDSASTAALTVLTAFARTLLAATTAADTRAILGIGAIVTKTASYSVAVGDNTILCDATTGAIVIGLPAAATNVGQIINVKKIDASANTVTLDGNASETIDGASTKVISSQWVTITVHCDGVAWFIL